MVGIVQRGRNKLRTQTRPNKKTLPIKVFITDHIHLKGILTL